MWIDESNMNLRKRITLKRFKIRKREETFGRFLTEEQVARRASIAPERMGSHTNSAPEWCLIQVRLVRCVPDAPDKSFSLSFHYSVRLCFAKVF